MTKITDYLKSLIRANTLDSSKSFSMLACVFLGLFLGAVLGFCLIWDTVTNGYIKTDADTIWWTLTGIAVIVTGGSVAKIASERKIVVNAKKEVNNGKRE